MRGVDATVNFAIATPAGVNRRSGSAVRFPITVTVVSLLITATPFQLVVPGRQLWRPPPHPARVRASRKQSDDRLWWSCGQLLDRCADPGGAGSGSGFGGV